MTSCGAAYVARGHLSYTVKFHNVILYAFINKNTNKNISMSMCCKNVNDVMVEVLEDV